MEFGLSEEQQELAATVRAVLDKRADSAAVRTAAESETGYDTGLWELLCEQIGVAALGIPEEYDGAGFTLFESLIALEEVGRSLAPSPLLGTLVATEALLAGADDEVKTRLLPRIAMGETATISLDGSPALFGDQSAIVLAVVGDDLLELGPDAATGQPTMDQTIRLAAVDTATGTRIGVGPAARARADLVGAAGVAALQAGCAARALDMTVAYSKQRVQFGRQIGSFQALKHRMADMLVLVEMSRSASWAASYAVATGAENADQLAHIAKSYCSDALAQVAGETVQLHGGIAITWEHDAQLVFKRAHALGQLFGQAHQHRAGIKL
jgi:alkylation response protein AidB-like acyl-CoA dehydrogenase